MATHRLSNSNGDTLVDIEATNGDIHCVVAIDVFAKILLSLPHDKQDEFIVDLNYVQEIRGVFFETIPRIHDSDLCARRILILIAEKWNLGYSKD